MFTKRQLFFGLLLTSTGCLDSCAGSNSTFDDPNVDVDTEDPIEHSDDIAALEGNWQDAEDPDRISFEIQQEFGEWTVSGQLGDPDSPEDYTRNYEFTGYVESNSKTNFTIFESEILSGDRLDLLQYNCELLDGEWVTLWCQADIDDFSFEAMHMGSNH